MEVKNSYGRRQVDEAISRFESEFGLSSSEMLRQVSTGEMEETVDTISWAMLLHVRGDTDVTPVS